MADTEQLIKELAHAPATAKPVSPQRHIARILSVLGLYALVLQCWLLGLRPDLPLQLTRPLFTAELLLLVVIMVSATAAAAYTMYPDMYQKKRLLLLPYSVTGLLLAMMVVQLGMPMDARMVMPTESSHTVECTIYIGLASLLPAAAMIAYLKRGATVIPKQAGALIVLAATAMGALTLRLMETTDPASHQLVWHYLPNFVFAMIGAQAGKWFLRW